MTESTERHVDEEGCFICVGGACVPEEAGEVVDGYAPGGEHFVERACGTVFSKNSI
jgi:hypothetical protein